MRDEAEAEAGEEEEERAAGEEEVKSEEAGWSETKAESRLCMRAGEEARAARR